MVYQGLLGLMLDEDYGDITDPTTGRDIKVSCTKQAGKKWAMTDVRPRGKSTALSGDSKKAQEWLGSIPSIDDMYQCKSYDELSKIVNDWINDDVDGSTGYDSSEKNKTPSGNTTKESSNFSNIDDAFADLMSE
jgi:hypothetical protein